MYDYLLSQLRFGRVDANWIKARGPKWITAEQAEEIIATVKTESTPISGEVI